MLLVYSFRTFPKIDELNELFGEVFVFGKLNQDLERFKELIRGGSYSGILGVAVGKVSRIEKKTINKFGKTKKVSKGGKKEYFLDSSVELGKYFKISNMSSDSFCNWTMFKIKEFIEEEGLKTKFYFVHIKVEDITKLQNPELYN